MELTRTHVVALTNQKGGCGKTTTTVSLAAALAAQGYSVAVVDTDPQCNATDSFAIDRDQFAADGRFTLADAYIAKRPAREIEYDFGDRFGGRLTVVPGHKGLNTVSHRLEAQLQAGIANGDYSDLDADDVKSEHRRRLRHSLQSLAGRRDVILIDTPPDLGFLMTSALIAADWFLIPVFPSGYDLRGLESLLQNAQKVRERYNPTIRLLGVLLGNTDARAKLDAGIYQELGRQFSVEHVFRTTVNRSVRHREATVYGRTIVEHAGGQQPAEQYATLAREVVGRLTAQDAAPAGQEAGEGRVANGD